MELGKGPKIKKREGGGWGGGGHPKLNPYSEDFYSANLEIFIANLKNSE